MLPSSPFGSRPQESAVSRRHRLLALPAALLLPVLALTGSSVGTSTTTNDPAASPNQDALRDQVFGKSPGTHELLDRVQRDFTPVGATNQAFDAVGTTMQAVSTAS